MTNGDVSFSGAWFLVCAIFNCDIQENIPEPANTPDPGVVYSNTHQSLSVLPTDIPSDVARLNLSHNVFTDLPANGLAGLAQCIELDMSHNQLSGVKRGMFSGMTSLKELYLGENEILDIESGSFEGLSSLVKLDLTNNKLREINKDMWGGLSTLNELILTQNDIQKLDSDDFEGLDSLTILHSKWMPTKEIEAGTFNHLTSLSYLHTGLPQLRAVDRNLVKGLRNLEYFALSHNRHISDLEDNFFSDLSSCYDLQLDGLSLREIRRPMWNGLNTINLINLEFNKITHVPAGAFSGLNTLYRVRLDYNDLVSVDPGAFTNIPRLGYLLLDNNHLTSLSRDAFDADQFPSRPYRIDRFELSLGQNPLDCDQRLCWIKQYEQEQRLDLFYENYNHGPPDCENYPGVEWQDVQLQCN